MSAQAQHTPGPSALSGAESSGTVPVLDQVFAETVALFQSLRAVAAKIHSIGELTPDSWTILQGVDRDGAKTVADLAENCGVTSSQMQKLIKALEKQGAVERVENPESRRAKLVKLTEEGKSLIRAMDQREVELLSQLPLTASEADLRAAAEALGFGAHRDVRRHLAQAAQQRRRQLSVARAAT